MDVQAVSLPAPSCTSAPLRAASYAGEGQEERAQHVTWLELVFGFPATKSLLEEAVSPTKGSLTVLSHHQHSMGRT